MDWEKMPANHISNKGFISRIYKKFSKNPNNPIRKQTDILLESIYK